MPKIKEAANTRQNQAWKQRRSLQFSEMLRWLKTTEQGFPSSLKKKYLLKDLTGLIYGGCCDMWTIVQTKISGWEMSFVSLPSNKTRMYEIARMENKPRNMISGAMLPGNSGNANSAIWHFRFCSREGRLDTTICDSRGKWQS